MKVRIVVNNRDRLTSLQKLIGWLRDADQTEIVILDNQSTYGPLLDYYRQIERRREIRVIRLRSNIGPRALWAQPDKKLLTPPFVLTDSDCVPSEECPLDLIDFLWRAGQEFKGRYQSEWGHGEPLQKIGPAFKLSNIPDHYKMKPAVLKWEKHIGCDGPGRTNLEGVDIYDAAIDTTFALYLRGDRAGYSAIRVGFPYLIDHFDWHVDSANPTQEESYYEQRAKTGDGFHSWGIKSCHSKVVNRYCKEAV